MSGSLAVEKRRNSATRQSSASDINPIPFSMRMRILANIQTAQQHPLRHPTKYHNMAMQRARASVCTNTAKTLNLLRIVIQGSINKEIDLLMKRYVDKFFIPVLKNISKNGCDISWSEDEYINQICYQILEEAQKMYQVVPPCTSETTPTATSSDATITESTIRLPKRKQRVHEVDQIHDEERASSSMEHGPKKQKISTDHDASGKVLSDIPNEDIPKWNPDRVTEATLFVLGSKANKALGMGAQRGKIYTKHPGLFRYIGDQNDRVWLYDNKIQSMRFGGKAFLLVLDDIRELLGSPEYRANPLVRPAELRGFPLPKAILRKVKAKMAGIYDELKKRSDFPQSSS